MMVNHFIVKIMNLINCAAEKGKINPGYEDKKSVSSEEARVRHATIRCLLTPNIRRKRITRRRVARGSYTLSRLKFSQGTETRRMTSPRSQGDLESTDSLTLIVRAILAVAPTASRSSKSS